MNQEYFNKIADLMLFAVDFKEGDKLTLTADLDLTELAHTVSGKAYKAGAEYVDITWFDQLLQAQAIAGKTKQFIYPAYMQEMYREISQPPWKIVALYSNIGIDVFQGLDEKRYGDFFKAYYKNRAIRTKAVMSSAIPWSLSYFPSAPMAQKAFPDLTAVQAIKKYWGLVIDIMQLDREDPVAYWKQKMEDDRRRIEFLEQLQPEYLQFTGPGTDLKVGIAKGVKWTGCFEESSTGQTFIANMPTAELFTSPDWRITEGKVTLTKPFVMHQILGDIPQDAWFVFEKGKVVDYGAAKGYDSLKAFLESNERNKYIGEVALVDPQSPFCTAGTTFYNGQYDENAACHIALGTAYPMTLKEQGDFTDEQLLEKGLNVSTNHEDMMIGGSDVDVTAFKSDGTSVLLIKDGKFLI